ncbi:MAG: MoxR family ATPase [SAR324 cluster bacterium]|nr:MoxR family ATPase [SAR324 cluster bacterium]
MSSLRDTFTQLQHNLQSSILGQPQLVERLLTALLSDGHLLVEGLPGLAKTRAVKALGDRIEGEFHRIQFTPDLLPSDVTGTDVFRPEDHSFVFQQGPIFHNLVLVDEVNRAPAKVQSALLEAMAERQVTIGRRTYPLPDLFLVMATQNPIEQEGTYPLPEAQLDRFLMKVTVDYPPREDEQRILRLARQEARDGTEHQSRASVTERIAEAEVLQARQVVLDQHLAEPLEGYIVELVQATRDPERYDSELAGWLNWGASPRATLALDRCARARAWLQDRDFVTPEDIQDIAPDVLRHRLLLSYEAESAGVSVDAAIQRLLSLVAVP